MDFARQSPEAELTTQKNRFPGTDRFGYLTIVYALEISQKRSKNLRIFIWIYRGI